MMRFISFMELFKGWKWCLLLMYIYWMMGGGCKFRLEEKAWIINAVISFVMRWGLSMKDWSTPPFSCHHFVHKHTHTHFLQRPSVVLSFEHFLPFHSWRNRSRTRFLKWRDRDEIIRNIERAASFVYWLDVMVVCSQALVVMDLARSKLVGCCT